MQRDEIKSNVFLLYNRHRKWTAIRTNQSIIPWIVPIKNHVGFMDRNHFTDNRPKRGQFWILHETVQQDLYDSS